MIPTTTTAIRLVTAQSGMCAVSITYTISAITATRSKTRCAKTVPSKRAQAPGCFMRLLSTATRASSPIRPGRIAFANRPTENAEKTSMKLGWGGSNACTITVRHASARMSTESRFRATAAATQRHSTAANAFATPPHAGPCHQSAANTPTAASTTSAARTRTLCTNLTARLPPVRRSPRAAARCRPRSSARPRAGAPLPRAQRGAAHPPAG